MSEKPLMKNCPFCDGDDFNICEWDDSFQVECQGCFTTTDYYEKKEDAIGAWNQRTIFKCYCGCGVNWKDQIHSIMNRVIKNCPMCGGELTNVR